MKKGFALMLAAVVFVGLHAGCNISEKFKIQKAKKRVHTILKGISRDARGSAADEQLAICRWWRDTALITDMGELGEASDAFDRWRIEGNITSPIGQFEINNARVVKGTKHFTVIISGTIDHFPFSLRVPEKDTISWGQAP